MNTIENTMVIFFVQEIAGTIEVGVVSTDRFSCDFGHNETLQYTEAVEKLNHLITQRNYQIKVVQLSLGQCFHCHKIYNFSKRRLASEVEIFHHEIGLNQANKLADELGISLNCNPGKRLSRHDHENMAVWHGYCCEACKKASPMVTNTKQ